MYKNNFETTIQNKIPCFMYVLCFKAYSSNIFPKLSKADTSFVVTKSNLRMAPGN